MTEPTRCRACGKPLELENTEEPSPDDDDLKGPVRPLYLKSLWCVTPGCPLQGGTQPQGDRSRTTSAGPNGSTHNFRQGRVSNHEGNIPEVIARLEKDFPIRFAIAKLPGGKLESGGDIEIVCAACTCKTEGQVVRSVAEDSASQAGRKGASWRDEHPSEFLDRLQKRIDKKTGRIEAAHAASMFLIVDASEDTFWPIREPIREAITEAAQKSPWRGVVVIEVDRLYWAKPGEPHCTCKPANGAP
jgi:hypothetical protein